MYSLKTKELLLRVAKFSQKKEGKISKREIEKKIHQIKHFASKDLPKSVLRKETAKLERLLKKTLSLEKEKEREITALKKQIKKLKRKLSAGESAALKRKIEKLSHVINDLMAREEVRREVEFEQVKKGFEGKVPAVTLKKIDEFKEKILALKRSGKCPPEKIAQLEGRLFTLEKKMPIKLALTSREEVKHKMLFGPQD